MSFVFKASINNSGIPFYNLLLNIKEWTKMRRGFKKKEQHANQGQHNQFINKNIQLEHDLA